MSLVSDIMQGLDDIRGIGGELGLRPYKVSFLVRSWSGVRPNDGISTDAPPVVLTTGNGCQSVIVKQVSAKEIVASGGLYRDRDLKVGPLTPPYVASLDLPAGGFADATLDPVPTGAPVEVFWNVQGPDMPPGGSWFERLYAERTALHHFFILRATGQRP